MLKSTQLRHSLPSWPLRFVALGCALLVGLLSFAAVSPEIHAALHGETAESCRHAPNPAEPDHSCAVTLFSQGIGSGLTVAVVLSAPEPVITEVIALADQVVRAARAPQLPPGCGPPIS